MEKPYTPVRCALWFEPSVKCVGRTEQWSKRFCPCHYQHYLVATEGRWSHKIPLGFVIRSTPFRELAPSIYINAIKEQNRWKGNSRNYYEAKRNTLFKLRADDAE